METNMFIVSLGEHKEQIFSDRLDKLPLYFENIKFNYDNAHIALHKTKGAFNRHYQKASHKLLPNIFDSPEMWSATFIYARREYAIVADGCLKGGGYFLITEI